MASKTTSRAERPIDLQPGEADVLSCVAAYANAPDARTELETVLSTSTKRARAIGAVILDTSRKSTPKYKFMAKRFAEASVQNLKNEDILSVRVLAS